jgi:5'-3' exoribonuclease 1
MREFYPLDFELDLNGRSTPWEAIILIPFVDEDLLFAIENRLTAEGKIKLTAEEENRNTLGNNKQITWIPETED